MMTDDQLQLFAQNEDHANLPVVTASPASQKPSPQDRSMGPDEAEFAVLVNVSETELRASKGNEKLQRAAICRYFLRGTNAGYGMDLLVDTLGVSDNNLLEVAGFDDEEAQEIMDTLGDISDDEVAAAV
jgi:hypothetical protein